MPYRGNRNIQFKQKKRRKKTRKVSSFFNKKTFGFKRWLLMLMGIGIFFFFPKLKEKLKM